MTSERAESQDELLITATGYAELIAELEVLRTQARQELTEQLRHAREDGGPDNPALFDVLDGLGRLEHRIALLETYAAQARVAEPPPAGEVGVGSTVRVRDRETGEIAVYELVGPIEADIVRGRVSIAAPVGRALLGRRVGEAVDVATPRGTMVLDILGVHAGEIARAA